jgi:hypothetical protein
LSVEWNESSEQATPQSSPAMTHTAALRFKPVFFIGSPPNLESFSEQA